MASSDWASAEVSLKLDRHRPELYRLDRSQDDHPQNKSRLRWFEAVDNAELAIEIRLPHGFSQPNFDVLHVEMTINDCVTYTWTLNLNFVIAVSDNGSAYSINYLFFFRDEDKHCVKGLMRVKLGTDNIYRLVTNGPRIEPPERPSSHKLGSIRLDMRRGRSLLGKHARSSSMRMNSKAALNPTFPHVVLEDMYKNGAIRIQPTSEEPTDTERSARFEFRFGSKEALERIIRVKGFERRPPMMPRGNQEREPEPKVAVRENSNTASPSKKPRQHDDNPRRSRSPSRDPGLNESIAMGKKVADDFVAQLKAPTRRTPYPAELGAPPVVSVNPPRRPNYDLYADLKQHYSVNTPTCRPDLGQLKTQMNAPRRLLPGFGSPGLEFAPLHGSTAPNTPHASPIEDLDSETKAQITAIERAQRKGVLRAQIIPLEIEEEELHEKYKKARSTGSDGADLKKAIVKVQRKREPLEIERHNIKLEEQKEELLKKAQAPR